jgi:hypothetical protein
MRNFNKLANLHNMFFKRSDDLSRKPVRSSNPPPEPKPNPKPVPEPTDGWNTPGMNKGNYKKVLTGRGYAEDSYNADTDFARGVRKAVNTYGVHPDQFKGEDPTKNNMVKWIPRLGAGGQINSPLIPRGAQPVPADASSQVAGAVAGGAGSVLGGPTSSVSNAPVNPDTFNDITDTPPSGRSPVSLSDYDKYRQGRPGR